MNPVTAGRVEADASKSSTSGPVGIAGRCNVCGREVSFSYADPALYRESLFCEHCLSTSRYRSIARGLLRAIERLTGIVAPSLAELPRSAPRRLRVYDTQPAFRYGNCAYPLPELLAASGWIDVVASSYKPQLPLGIELRPGVLNQDLQRLTFADASIDIVVTSDVMEHVRLPERAHAEIRRVLRAGGHYVFTVPHGRMAETLVRVKVHDPEQPALDEHLLEPEYHGDVNNEGPGALSYRVFGTDLDEQLRALGFSVLYTKENLPAAGILDTELFECWLPGAEHDAVESPRPSWALDVDDPGELHAGPIQLVRWMEPVHCAERRRVFVLLADEVLRSPLLALGAASVLSMSFVPALAQISDDGLTLEASLFDWSGRRYPLLSVARRSPGEHAVPDRITVDLRRFAGREMWLELRCGPGPEHDPRADWLGLVEVAIGALHELALLQARTQRQWRMGNEVVHLSASYGHALYGAAESRADAPTEWAVLEVATGSDAATAPATVRARLAGAEPTPGETAYMFSHRLLFELMPRRPPHFGERLRTMPHDGPVHVLSLCAGAARIEAALARHAGRPIELTLVDVNRDLLERAARALPGNVRVALVQADVNSLPALPRRFHVALCVSGLHHVVELERVAQTLAGCLVEGGEFWSIGEQVGRNGNRLWQDDWQVANALFAALPERLRFNRGTQQIDTELPNVDCSTASFEGIRSEEVLGVLDRYFDRGDVHVRNVFLWRLLDLAYMDNWHLDDAADRALICDLVCAEFLHWRAGGHASELNGIFVRRE